VKVAGVVEQLLGFNRVFEILSEPVPVFDGVTVSCSLEVAVHGLEAGLLLASPL
jgi:hypothetical protein